jgi:hypothetical protein
VFKVEEGSRAVLFEGENKIATVGINEVIKVVYEASAADAAVAETPKLKVHQPEPEKKPHAVFDDIEFDDALIAKMMQNIAANGMSLADLGG